MNCPKCNYAMSAFDASCPRCRNLEAPTSTSAVNVSPATVPVATPASVVTTPKKSLSPKQFVFAALFSLFALFFARGMVSRSLGEASPSSAPFDVPALVGLSMQQVAGKLGTPETPIVPSDAQLKMFVNAGVTTWDVNWKKGRHSLLVEYEMRTGRVVNFFIPSVDPSGATTDVVYLRGIGTLNEKPTRYVLKPVPALGQPGKFTGLLIEPLS